MAYFSRSIEQDKYQGTIYEGPQGILTITVEVKKIISLSPNRLLKTQSFWKKGKLSTEQKILAYFFLVFSTVTNLTGNKL